MCLRQWMAGELWDSLKAEVLQVAAEVVIETFPLPL